ncbi:hypothetical protein TNCV_4493381 [Trichonephila clavipes]|uniref:Uncharacterized protein n=1 Tax=Trichonephila clavipes TaxID=2585209 RepID=A0A8X6SP16_TRICX|nr:hypothetical protein TNCV_4493381 [Trichonephila clavipes]
MKRQRTNTEQAGRRSDPETSWRRSSTYGGIIRKEPIARTDHGGVGEVTVRTGPVSISSRAFSVVDDNRGIFKCVGSTDDGVVPNGIFNKDGSATPAWCVVLPLL